MTGYVYVSVAHYEDVSVGGTPGAMSGGVPPGESTPLVWCDGLKTVSARISDYSVCRGPASPDI